MVKRKVEFVESDISGEPDAATVTFGLDGTWYDIDLTEEEGRKFEQALKPYITQGRKAVTKGPAKARGMSHEEREEIRAWAKQENYTIADFGRIPGPIMDAYKEAHDPDRAKPVKRGKAEQEQVTPGATPGEIRGWAKQESYDIADFGRIPGGILAAFNEAHGIS